jgi:hypothetical protein
MKPNTITLVCVASLLSDTTRLDGYDIWSCVRVDMTGWLWHRIMCQSGHDWMAMTYDHVSEWTWLDGYDIWSCVRVDTTGWLWHMIMCQSGHDWMAMTWSCVRMDMTGWLWHMIMCQSGHDWMAMTWSCVRVGDISTVSDTTWLDSYDIGSCVRVDMFGCYDIWSCVRVDMTGWLWHMIMCQSGHD